jgi:hypothetical protein
VVLSWVPITLAYRKPETGKIKGHERAGSPGHHRRGDGHGGPARPGSSARRRRSVVVCRIIARMEAGSAPRRQTSMTADAGVEIAWEMAEEFGAPTLEHYRRVYAACGVPWPDDEVRRLLPVAVHS